MNMGMYTWLTEQDFERYSKVSDPELNEIFQEVRILLPNVYIAEVVNTVYSFLPRKKKITISYQIYNRIDNDMEVRVLNINTSNKDYVANYLFGLMNGYRKALVEFVNKKDES